MNQVNSKQRTPMDPGPFVLGLSSDQGSGRQVGLQCLAWITLAAYTGLLVYLDLHHGYGDASAGVPLWKLQDTDFLVGWIQGFVLGGVYRFGSFIPVGFIVAIALDNRRQGWSRVLRRLCALIVGAALVVLVCSMATGWSWHWGDALCWILPGLGCLLGLWIGHTWLRGWWARLWLVPKVVALLILVGLCAGALFLLLVEEEPMSFAATPVTSADKRRLIDLFRSKSPRMLRDGQTETLHLTEHDISVLLSWGLSLGSPHRKATVRLNQNAATVLVSVGLPLGRQRLRYLNLVLAGRAYAVPQILTLQIDRCRLGFLEIPQRLLAAFSPVMTSLLSHWRVSQPFFDATQDIAMQAGSIAVTYGPIHFQPHRFREGIFGADVLSQEDLASTRAQVDNLLAATGGASPGDLDLGACLETVFTLARVRSATRDPVMENRAGLFALGMLLGHHRFEEFLGPVLAGPPQRMAERVLRDVKVQGRSDWTRHFCLSAAIYALSDREVSNAAGLLKEELDAGTGGSGFSFTDLLADQAGTTFAAWAVRDPATARALQDRWARGAVVEDFFPPAADLPEGLSEAELQSQYGGVGGEGYHRVMAEIRRRIANCAGYRAGASGHPQGM